MILGCDTIETTTPASSCELEDLWSTLEDNMSSLELEILELKSYGYSTEDLVQKASWPEKMSFKGKLKAVYSALDKAKRILGRANSHI